MITIKELREARMPSDKDIEKKHGNATNLNIYKKGFLAAKQGKKITSNPYKQTMFGRDHSQWNRGFTDGDQGFNIKKTMQYDYDKNGVMKYTGDGWKKEEVELTEAVSDRQVAKIKRMTSNNDHFGARFELARLMNDKQLMGFYDSLEKMHRTLPPNIIGNDAIKLRGRLERVLRDRLKSKFKADADRLVDAL